MNANLDRFSCPMPREFRPTPTVEWVLEVRTAGLWVDVASFDDQDQAEDARFEMADEFVGQLRVVRREVEPLVIGCE